MTRLSKRWYNVSDDTKDAIRIVVIVFTLVNSLIASIVFWNIVWRALS